MSSLFFYRAQWLRVGCLLLASVFLFGFGCCDCPPRQPKRYIVFLDRSGSFDKAQGAHWGGIAANVIKQLLPGDRLEIRLITGQTLNEKPLLAEEAPVCHNQSTEAQLRCKQQLAELKAKANEVLQQALNSDNQSQFSDIFSAFDRITPDARPSATLLFTDGLHCPQQPSTEPDFEKQPLNEDQFGKIVQSLANSHYWQPQQLAHTVVYVVSPSAGTSRQLNNSLILRRFYETLTRSLGGRLASFDTTLPPDWNKQTIAGGTQ